MTDASAKREQVDVATGKPVVAFGADVWPDCESLVVEAAGGRVVRLPVDPAVDALPAAAAMARGLVVRTSTRVDAALLARLPALQAVATASAGHDHLDLDALAAAGVAVFDACGANADAAADMTLALILALARHVVTADASMKHGSWLREELAGIELAGRRLGIVGIGRVGSRVAQRALAFGMHVAATDPYVRPEALPADLRGRVELVELPALLAQSDVVTLHTPLTAETRLLLGAERLQALKPGALLINTARGPLVDEAALAERLHAGAVAGAGLDVYAAEPLPADSPLRAVPPERLVLTPHIAGATHESRRRMGTYAVERLLAHLRGDDVTEGRLV